MAATAIYSVDSSALIHGWRRVYRPKNFGFVWERLDALIREGRLQSSIEVYNELEKKDDELFKWCKDRKEEMFVEIDDDVQNEVAGIMKLHPRLVDTVRGRSGARPFCDSADSVDRNSEDGRRHGGASGQDKNPRCMQRREYRSLRGLADLIEREDWKFEK